MPLPAPVTAEHQYAVMELGASHQGEIDYTSQLVQPQVAGIINVGTAHLGEFGGREGICRAKSEIYAHIAKMEPQLFRRLMILLTLSVMLFRQRKS